jgi:hypothetical protein
LRSYYADFSARDWEAYAAHFWPGTTFTAVWQPAGEERLLGAEIRVHGNLAHAWARYAVRFGDQDSMATWRGIDAFTLLWHDESWKIAALAYTDE